MFDQHLLAAPLSIPAFFNEVLQLLREVILYYELLWSRMVLIDNLEKYINHKVETLQTTRIISFTVSVLKSRTIQLRLGIKPL